MKVFFLSNTGHAYIDYVNPKFRLIECKDGYHPITNDAIWKAGESDDEAVMFIWHGRSSPEGQNEARVRFVMKETNRLKENRQPIKVSKLWVRRVKQVIVNAVWFFIFAFVIYVAYLIWAASRMS